MSMKLTKIFIDLLFCFLSLSLALDVVVFSPTVNVEYLESDSISSIFKLYAADIEETISLLNNSESPTILIDLSDYPIDHFRLSRVCEELKIPHFVIEDSLHGYKKWTYSAISSKESYQDSLHALLNFFNWTDGLVIISSKNIFLQNFMLGLSSDFSSIIIEKGSSINETIAHIIAPSGKTLIYLFADSIESVILQEILVSSKLMVQGNGILLGKESSYKPIIDGSLAITEIDQEFVKSNEEFLRNSIEGVISLFENKSIVNSFQIKRILDSKCISNFCKSGLSLVSYHNGERVIVGSLNLEKLSLTNTIMFPGNLADPPTSAKKILPISINAGSTNPGGESEYTVPIYARGSSMAVSMVNQGFLGILENFKMSLFFFDCGATSYDPVYGRSCFKKDMDKFGLGHLASFPSSVTIGTLSTFKELNVSLPVIGSTNSAPRLNATHLYPWYTRVQMSDSFLASNVAPLLKIMGWRSFAVIYGNEAYGIGCYLSLKSVAEKNGLTILNPEWSRAIPPELTREQSSRYIDSFKAIYNSNARFIVIFLYSGTTCGYVLEHFYDFGARKGDIVVATSSVGILTEIGFEDEFLYKRYEIGVPMLNFQSSVWVGNFGKFVYNELEAKYNTIPHFYQCNFFDATYLLSSAIDSMIIRGLDYANPYKLNTTIRSMKIIGCLGITSISKGSNDNEFTSISIDSNKIINGTLNYYSIGLFNPFSSKLLTIYQPFIYGDDSEIKPSDLRNENDDCPFPKSKITSFPKGRIVVFCICFTIAIITAAITYYIWKRWWDIKIEPLTKEKEISVQDVIVAASIGIEFFQYISMGPDFSKLFEILSKFSDAISLSLANIINLQNGTFWIVCNIILGSCLFWVIECATILFQLSERFNFILFNYLDRFGDYLMPILGNLCFLPFVSVILDVFVCDEAIGDNFSDSFLHRDCYQFCWQKTHIIYVVFSIIALAAYEPLAVYCRPLWQEFQDQLNVKTLPSFLMIKTVVQVLLIVMNKTIKRAQHMLHGFLFLSVIVCFALFTHKYKPYNYARYSWWGLLSLVGVAWLSLLATIETVVGSSNSMALVIALFIGWAFLGIYGYIVMKKKYPSLLYRPKGIDTSTLFQFAFSFKNNSKVKDSTFTFKHSTKILPGDDNNH